MTNLTLILPTKKESESLPVFLKEIEKYKYKKLIVLEKEDNETKKVISKIHDIEILVQKKNGYGNALIEGINATKTEYCCIINADGSMDPKYLNNMLTECKNRDLVFCSRYEKEGGSDDDNVITFIGNKFFSFLGNLLFQLNISDILFTYILGKTSSFKSLNLNYEDFRICVEIPIKAKIKNLNYNILPSFERNRIAGKKKVNAIKDGILILFAIIYYYYKKFFK